MDLFICFRYFFAVNGSVLNYILNKINPYVVLVVLCVLTLAFLYMRSFLEIKGDPFIVVFLSLAVVSLCRLTKRNFLFLAFVGKHSMNMYLMHTFVFCYFFEDFIYGFNYPIVILQYCF